MNLTDEFTALIFGFQTAKIDFAVCGGWALALHGFPRLTQDIDFLVQTDDLARILAVAWNCGYDHEIELFSLGPADSPTEIRRLNKFQGEDHVVVDFVLVNPRLQDVWNEKLLYVWKDLTVSVVSAAGLAKMKRLAGRAQDLVDIATLGFKLDDPAIQP